MTQKTFVTKMTAIFFVFISAFLVLQFVNYSGVDANITVPRYFYTKTVVTPEDIKAINLRVVEIGENYVDIAWNNVDGLSNRYNIEITRKVRGIAYNADLSLQFRPDPCWNCLSYTTTSGATDTVIISPADNGRYRILGLHSGVLYTIRLGQWTGGTGTGNNFNNIAPSVAVQTRGAKSAQQIALEQSAPAVTAVPYAIVPTGTTTLVDGDLIRAYGEEDVYIYKKAVVGPRQYTTEYARLILNPAVFNSYGHLSWDAIKEVSGPMRNFLLENAIYTTNFVRQVNGDEKVYMLFPSGDVGIKRHIQLTGQQFESVSNEFYGYDRPRSDIWSAIYNVNEVELNIYTTGAPITSTTELYALLRSQRR